MQWPATKRSGGDFSGLPHGDPTHCCIFDHIRHNWPEATPGALTANGAKCGFDLARAEPVAVPKHGRPVAAVTAIEELERMKALDAPAAVRAPRRKAKQ
jgi:hypothetical protein